MEINRQSLLDQTTGQDDDVIRDWFFAFCDNPTPLPFWMRPFIDVSPREFHHCYAFTQVGPFVLFVEPTFSRIDFVVKYPEYEGQEIDAGQIADTLVAAGHVVVNHKYSPSIVGRKALFNFLPTCVTVVKVATGYSSLAITPIQLFKSLVKDGAHIWVRR